MRRGSIVFLKLVLAVMGLVAIMACVVWLPASVEHYARIHPDLALMRYPLLIGVYVTAIPFFIALYQAYVLLKLIEARDAFSESAVRALQRIKQCAATIAVLYAVMFAALALRQIWSPAIAATGASIVFAALTVAFFAAVLQELLKQALQIKSENDLTI
ncbi:DUF2975 domain-containing protein [Paenibacillus sp. J5C_2022]|uniref:DUF2975 domain-containing protein n=1 Tax=Paenibacillus sp. J5C2022 TaxID=2977129 RepID=UPI0021CE495B|nr:DUF2975 domain-containing protein [Paenibacillus sp. J5C2022]MCU6707985.1 DUF2975 domain-containing protein [Paenibacillus sp. J5C2022]